MQNALQQELKSVTKDFGQIVFYENTDTIQYDYSLKGYYENANVIFESFSKLNYICKNMTDQDDCKYYIGNKENDLKMVKKNVNFIKSKHRQKRFWTACILGTAKAAKVILPASVLTMGASAVFTEYRIHQEKLYYAKKQAEASKTELEIEQKELEVAKKALNDTKRALEILKEENKKRDEYEKLKDIIQSTLTRHISDSEIIINVLNGNVKDYLFKMVDIRDFANSIKLINESLEANYSLPNVGLFDLLEFSTVYHAKNDTHVQILINIPILNPDKSNLSGFIPLPFKQRNSVFVMDSKSEFLFMLNNTLKMIPREYLNHCKRVKSLTICSSIVQEFIEEPELCVKEYFKNDTNDCIYKRIISQNYFVDTSDFSVYCFIVKPIVLRISCAKTSEILNIDTSQEIFFEKHCELFKMTNKTILKTNSYTAMEIENKYVRPNLSTFDTNTNDWTEVIQRIDQYGTQYTELYDATEEILEKENSEDSFWTFITEISIFSIIKYIFCLFLIILSIKIIMHVIVLFKKVPTI